MNDHDNEAFSFARSATSHGRQLSTKLTESAVRLPLNDEEHPLFSAEQEALEALGLAPGSELLVIERVRFLDGEPSAIHRVFIDPARMPKAFVERHDLETTSLIDMYREYGYKLLSRDTVLSARGTNLYETNLLGKYPSGRLRRVVLDAEQRLYAEDSKTSQPFVLEFLKASYLEDWKYEVKNRPA